MNEINRIIADCKVESEDRTVNTDVKEIISMLASGKRIEHDMSNTIVKEIFSNIKSSSCLPQYLLQLKKYDDYTYAHCFNVAFYAMMIGSYTVTS